MGQLSGIQLAIEMAIRSRDALAKGVARAQRNLGSVHEQMSQLEGYAGETDARWIGPAAASRSVELVRHHYHFMGRLQHAIALQTGVIVSTGRQVDAAKAELLKAEFRLAGLEKVLSSRKAALDLRQRRGEQRQSDEFAAMQHARNSRNSLTGDI